MVTENTNPNQGTALKPEDKKKKSLFKKWWFWVIIVLIVAVAVAGGSGNNTSSTSSTSSSATSKSNQKQEKVADLHEDVDAAKSQDLATVLNTLKSKNILGTVKTSANVDKDMRETIEAGIANGTAYTVTDAKQNGNKIDLIVDTTDHFNRQQALNNATQEQKNAVKKAQMYADNMYMSRQGIYDQLTSEYGERFSADVAQFAIDNIDVDYNENALKKAKSYQETMAMSAEAIREQLTSEYGEKFTQDEANYAIAHLND